MPPDDGFGTPGNRTLSTPPLVEVADTGPFFHDNSVDTLEGAVAFYDGDAFNGSPAGRAQPPPRCARAARGRAPARAAIRALEAARDLLVDPA